MSDVLFIQNTKIEGSGYLGDLINQDGFRIKSIYAKQEKIPKQEFSLVIILGAPESANDELVYLQEEQELIKNSVEKETPVLGICLGSQLIAKAFGGRVYPGPKKEIGFYNDLVPESNSSLFSGFSSPFKVFHWHGDTFDLPQQAIRLVHSKNYSNQAFQFQSAIGLQFHLEVDEAMVNLWLDKTEEKLATIPYIDTQKIRSDINKNISTVQENMRIFYSNFKNTFKL